MIVNKNLLNIQIVAIMLQKIKWYLLSICLLLWQSCSADESCFYFILFTEMLPNCVHLSYVQSLIILSVYVCVFLCVAAFLSLMIMRHSNLLCLPVY